MPDVLVKCCALAIDGGCAGLILVDVQGLLVAMLDLRSAFADFSITHAKQKNQTAEDSSKATGNLAGFPSPFNHLS